jgi:hypothetical protein
MLGVSVVNVMSLEIIRLRDDIPGAVAPIDLEIVATTLNEGEPHLSSWDGEHEFVCPGILLDEREELVTGFEGKL